MILYLTCYRILLVHNFLYPIQWLMLHQKQSNDATKYEIVSISRAMNQTALELTIKQKVTTIICKFGNLRVLMCT